MVFILYTLLVLVVFLILGLIFEEVSSFKEEIKISPPGTLVETDNGEVHVYSKGEGEYTVVFSSDIGVSSPFCDYYTLQEKVSQFSKTALYERYGYGFSSNIVFNGNLDELVEDIRLSLRKAGHTPPYILVPHSMSSIESLHFAQKYPNEIKGIIMNDGTNPWFSQHKKNIGTPYLRLIQFLKYTGVLRLITLIPYFKNKINIANLPNDIQSLNLKLFLKNVCNENMFLESKNISQTCSTVLDEENSIGNIPLIILTAENHPSFTQVEKDAWYNTQKDLLSWSSNSKQIIVNGTDNFIHHSHGGIISIAIKEILEN